VKKLLRLTGGSFAGRRLYVPGSGVRPATNMVREAVFSTLFGFFEEGMEGLAVLDLFAGTGSLGLEAISRGASRVTFVDRMGESIRSIGRNLRILGYRAEVVRSDVLSFLKRQEALDYDIIFMDPPYSYKKCGTAVHLIVERVSDGPAVLVHERAWAPEPPSFDTGARLYKRKKYGQTEILYYRLG